ncbi:MAG TPA: response regulator transcription factor [Gaiellaceae bacterium]|nr:response regulator transcription factor [Gaiellaceae bacterium]
MRAWSACCENGLEVVGSSGTAEDLLLKVRSLEPDVAIVDIRLPPTHNDEGMEAALEIRATHPTVGVLVLSQYVELGLAMKLLADSAEGAGYLLKDRISDVKEFVAAVRRGPTAARRSTRSSSRRSSRNGETTTRSPS